MGILLQIVLAFMRVSAIAFGGAYATIPLVEHEAVVVQHWMTYAEFADLIPGLNLYKRIKIQI